MSESTDIRILKDFDLFLYYGQNDLDIETKHDVMLNLMQPKRSLFYNRALDSAGVPDYENMPEGLIIRVDLPYTIVDSLSRRNQFVSNGENGSRDRRIAPSQSEVIVNFDSKTGNVDVSVYYFPLANFKQTQGLQFSLGA